MNQIQREHQSYKLGYFRACKSMNCQRALKWLTDDSFMNLPVKDIDPLSYESGFESGLRESGKYRRVSQKFEQALKVSDGRGVSLSDMTETVKKTNEVLRSISESMDINRRG